MKDGDPWKEVERLQQAIIKHRDQKADDRCWMDDHDLYAVLGGPEVADNRVGDKHLMMANCYRFIEQRCESGRWRSYIDLEKELNEAHQLLDTLGVPPQRYIIKDERIFVPAIRSLTERLSLLVGTFTDAYRSQACPKCRRQRVQSDGVCEKCFWDVDGNDYASITRPTEYSATGPIFVQPDENLPDLGKR